MRSVVCHSIVSIFDSNLDKIIRFVQHVTVRSVATVSKFINMNHSKTHKMVQNEIHTRRIDFTVLQK